MFSLLKKYRNDRGMSLIEIMIVLGIIAAASAAILSSVIGGSTKAKIKQANIQLDQLVANIKMYKSDEGSYPSEDDGLDALVSAGFYEETPKDPWGNEFVYSLEGKKFSICSEGEEEEESTYICRPKKKDD